jgi:hypothetical protein
LHTAINFIGLIHARRSRTASRVDQAIRGIAEEASLTSMRRRGDWPNSTRNLKIPISGPIPSSPKR